MNRSIRLLAKKYNIAKWKTKWIKTLVKALIPLVKVDDFNDKYIKADLKKLQAYLDK
jgi:hypothetical protein